MIIILACPVIHSQSLNDLESQRIRIIQDIDKTSQELTKYNTGKVNNISRYNTLEIQLANTQALYKNLEKEIKLLSAQKKDSPKLIDDKLEHQKKVLDKLIKQLLNESYEKSIILHSNTKDNTIRKSYTNQLINFRKNLSVNQELTSQDSLINLKQFKLAYEQNRIDSISSELKKIDAILKNQITSSQKAQATLEKKQTERSVLNNKIKALINNTVPSTTSTYSSNTKSIVDRQGFLTWPMNNGIIKLRYGQQKHPDNDKVIFVNSGIDISSYDNRVLSIHPGTIKRVTNISPSNITIIIQHEKYFYTVYSNLSKAYQSEGNYVGTSEVIGTANNVDNKHVLHFELWQGKENLNPYQWLQNN